MTTPRWTAFLAALAIVAGAASNAAAGVRVTVIRPSGTAPIAELLFVPSNLEAGCGGIAAARRGGFPAVLTLRTGGRGYAASSRSLCDTLGFAGRFWSWATVLGDPSAGGFLFQPALGAAAGLTKVEWRLEERGRLTGTGAFSVVRRAVATTKEIESGTYAYESDCSGRSIHSRNGIQYCTVPSTRIVTTIETG